MIQRFHNGATTSSSGLRFNFQDGVDAPYIYDADKFEGRKGRKGRGDASIFMRVTNSFVL